MVLGLDIGTCTCAEGTAVLIPAVLPAVISGVSFALGVLSTLVAVVYVKRNGIYQVDLGLFRAFPSKMSKTDKTTAEIANQKLFEMRSSLLKIVFSMAAPSCLLLISALAFWRVYPDELVANVAYLFFVFLFAIGLFFFWFPSHWTMRTCDLYFGLFFVIYAILPSLTTTVESYHFLAGWARAVHLVLAHISPGGLHYIPANVLHLAWQLWLICSSPALRSSMIENILLAAFTTSCNIVCNIATGVAFWDTAKALLKASFTETIVKTLLSSMCDSLVMLRSDLTLRDDTPSLAAMLLSTSGTIGKAGQAFASCLMAHDVERFEEFVRSGAQCAQHAQQIHVDLRDCMGKKVTVQIYHICLQDPFDSTLTHFLGVQEENQFERNLTGQGQDLPGSALHMEVMNAEREALARMQEEEEHSEGSRRRDAGRPTETQLEETVSVQSARTRSSSSTSMQQIQEHGQRGWDCGSEVSITLRTWLSWEIVHESEESRNLFAFCQDDSALAFLSRFGKPHSVLRWIEFSHAMAAFREPNPASSFHSLVKISSPFNSLGYSSQLLLEVVNQPPLPPEEDPEVVAQSHEFEPHSRFVDLKLVLTAAPSPKSRSRRASSSSQGTPARRRQIAAL